MITARLYRDADRGAFALVVTLIMVVLAAIAAVGMLTSAALDRTIAKSVVDHYQAEVAAQNGLEAAKKALSASPTAGASITADDSFLVLRADGSQTNATGAKDAYYYLAKAHAGAANTVDCYPLFAGGVASSVAIDLTKTPSFQLPVPPASPFATDAAQEQQGQTARLYPTLLAHQQPAYTQWKESRDPNDTATAPAHNLPYQRYTFWVEDAGGLIDANVAGNQILAGAHQRSNGTNPNEIAVFTIFEPALQSDSGKTLAKNLLDNRSLLFTTPTLKQIAPPPAGKTDKTQETLVVRTGVDVGGERNLVPFGFAFPDEGTAKTNLNSVIADASKGDDAKVTSLAKVIDVNLPKFAALRKGALAASQNYTKSLAAGIISYATLVPIRGIDYRGIGLHPFAVEFFEKFTWEKNGPESFYLKNGTYWADVKAAAFVEVWNMTNRDISTGTLTFSDINRYYAYVGGSSEKHAFEDKFGTKDIVFDAANPLLANEFKVFKVYEHLYNFDSGLAVKPLASTGVKLGSEASVSSDPTDCGYIAKWNGTIVDRAGSGSLDGGRADGSDQYPELQYYGLERGKATLTTPGSAPNPTWRGTLPGLRYSLPASFGESVYNLGDPRSGYLIGQVQAAVAYDIQSAWGGRMYQAGLVKTSGWKAAETTVANWPDGGHSTDPGTTPGKTTVDPDSLTGPVTQPSKGPTFAATGGKYLSATELSRVYDPIQWKPAGFPPASPTEFQQKWRDAWKSNMIKDGNYACASTLHIGSPEFKDFNSSDARASRLLDLFAVSDRRETRGLINLNTARRETLRALAAGIQMKSDPAIAPASVFGPVKDPAAPAQADKFADAVIGSRPFLSTAEIADIYTDPADTTSRFFGNSGQWSTAGPTEWNDTAREEYFSRFFDLATTRSRNFRVFVTGQSLDKNGRTLSSVNRQFQAYLRPTRDATGRITGQAVEITYAKDI